MTQPKQTANLIVRYSITLLLVLAAAAVVWHLYDYYTYAPQTRDGKIRADVVAVAADVSGRVDAVHVKDNQIVHKGDVLFTVDRARLHSAVELAQAQVATAQAALRAAQRENTRYAELKGVVSAQQVDTRQSAFEEAQAQYKLAIANRDLAELNLSRTDVVAPVNGVVTNLTLRPGAYAAAGQPMLAIVDSDSFYIDGYFEETKLSHIHQGDAAIIKVMGESKDIEGHVASLSAGIDDRERSSAAGTMLANVNPTFSWIRLAQRVPVRVAIDKVPKGLNLIAGRTASVILRGAQ
ncbi:efflux RND transporter periplasmic adaptor subunit [Limnobacter litoralis]|uniref:Membrane protein n=1 Tax=Limnobacter litoralis TaxID=481366 RepID=A0ABQ5YND5_9BURK|nr:HlyD family secretion protein [Limnobacter litoralis]GLR25632.1 membrane protein [Limnobacter litoralis]